MKTQKNWGSLSEVLKAMETAGPYIVLRNYEELDDENYFMSGHDDIDFLVTDDKKIREILDTVQDVKWRSQDHCFVQIKNVPVKIGLRYVGDNYYDVKWEQDMLEKRVNHGTFDIMDEENYFYSLTYHALLQKKKLSEDYDRRLSKMAKNLGIDISKGLYPTLFEYMKEKGYTVVYPKDPTVPLHYDNVPKELLGPKTEWVFRRTFFRIKRKLVKGFAVLTGKEKLPKRK